jgi:hypothetical protein
LRFLIELIPVISLKKESGETMKSNPEKNLAISFNGETTSQTAKVFFDNLARQNKRTLQQKSDLWSFDFEKSEQKFELGPSPISQLERG